MWNISPLPLHQNTAVVALANVPNTHTSKLEIAKAV